MTHFFAAKNMCNTNSIKELYHFRININDQVAFKLIGFLKCQIVYVIFSIKSIKKNMDYLHIKYHSTVS